MATKTTKQKERKKAAPPMTRDDVVFIAENIIKMSYDDIANQRGITRNQVNRVRTGVVNELRELGVKNPTKTVAINEYIETYLSRPDEQRGAGRGSGRVKTAITNAVDNILNNL